MFPAQYSVFTQFSKGLNRRPLSHNIILEVLENETSEKYFVILAYNFSVLINTKKRVRHLMKLPTYTPHCSIDKKKAMEINKKSTLSAEFISSGDSHSDEE